MAKKKRNINFWERLDWVTILLFFTLIILGWINIYAAVYNDEHQSIFDISQKYGKQLLFIFGTFIIITVIFLIDSNIYPALAYIIYLVTISALIGVLLFGDASHGAKSWFDLGLFKIQPAEFAKFATALAVANFMSKQNFKMTNITNLIFIVGILILPMVLILLQPDTGSAIIYVAFIFVLYREGLSGIFLWLILLIIILFVFSLLINISYIFIALLILSIIIFYLSRKNLKETALAIVIILSTFALLYFANVLIGNIFNLALIIFVSTIISSIIFIIYIFKKRFYNAFIIVAILISSLIFTYSVDYVYNNILQTHHRTRINVLLNIEDDPRGIGYNVNQSKIAIGSGGFTGKGFLQGTQTKYNFVPEQDTDFIFCTVGEEWGFLGTTLIIALFITLLLRLIFLAERQRSSFSRIYGYGVIALLFFHFMVNIGMAIGLLPVIGIPLPFFSYGGSSLWSFTILIFIFLKLDTSREELF